LLAWARWQEDVGEYGEARRKYRELLIAYPENIEAQLGLARIELACGRVQQAEEILTAVAAERPTNMPVRLELGRLYTQQEAWPKAIAAFEAASAIDPENQVCRYELGVVFARSHRFDQALSHLTYAVGGSAANYNIGYVLHEQGNDADAVEWFQNALNSHPDSNTAERTRAILAQLSPKNSRDRYSSPAFPSAHSPTQAIATRSKQGTIDQFEPASFAVPVIRPSSAGRQSQSGAPVPFVATSTALHEEAGASTILPPVNPQPAQFGIAKQSVQQSASGETMNPFQAVSHTASHDRTGQSTASGTSLPQWRATSHPAPVTQVQELSPSPPGWRNR
jgi:tetratricopeptide (TPR) repeat protein